MEKRNHNSLGQLAGIILAAAFLYVPAIMTAQALSLEQCIDTALVHNRNIQLSRHDIRIADEKNREAKSNLLPKLNGVADARHYVDQPYQLMPAESFGGPEGTYKEVRFGTPQSLNASLQLNLPVFSPALISAIKNSELAEEMTEIQKIKTDEEVVIDVTLAYYNAQILLSQLIFLDCNIANTEKLVETTTLLHQQEMAKGTDVDRLNLQLDQLITRRSSAFSQHRQVINALKFLMGKPLSDPVEILQSGESMVEPDFLPRTITDVLLMDKKIELNHQELKNLKNTRLPSVNAYGFYGTTGFGTTGSNRFFNFYPIGYFGAQVSIPLFGGTVTKHKITQKEIEIEKTTIQKELVTEKTELDRINAEMEFTQATLNITTSKTQTDLAKNIYDRMVMQNQQGLASITDVLLADNALREAQQTYIVALVDLRKAELEYKRVTGNLMTYKN